jgi:hypothetical protein
MRTVVVQLLQMDRIGGQTANDLVVALDQPQCQRPAGKTGGCSYRSSKRQQLQQRFVQLAGGERDETEPWGVAVAWAEM